MTALKYFDAGSGTWKSIASIQGPQGPPVELERISARATNSVAGSPNDVTYTPATITITPGRWMVRAAVTISTSVPDAVSCGVRNITAGAIVPNSIGTATTCGTAGWATDVSTEVELTVAVNTQLCPLGIRNGGSVATVAGGAASSVGGQISAVKLASVDAIRVPFVTVLPSAPLNGDEVYFQNAAMAASGVVWHFRYNAASASAYKWEFLGGPTMGDQVPANVAFNNTAWGALSGGPSLVSPLAGDYEICFGARIYNVNGAGVSTTLQVAINGAGTGYVIDSFQGTAGVNITLFAAQQMLRQMAVGVAANATIAMWCAVNGGQGNVATRWLTILPRRVG